LVLGKIIPEQRLACPSQATLTLRTFSVKCDEAKPECLRCLSFWGKCEGYNTLEEVKHVLPHKPHTLLPKSSPLRRKEAKIPITKARVIVRQPDVGPEFETSEDRHLFKLFLHCTSVSLSGAFDSPIFSRILPQHAATLPFLRYGIAALGALTVANLRMQSSYFDESGKKHTNMSVPCTEAWEKACHLYASKLPKASASSYQRTVLKFLECNHFCDIF